MRVADMINSKSAFRFFIVYWFMLDFFSLRLCVSAVIKGFLRNPFTEHPKLARLSYP